MEGQIIFEKFKNSLVGKIPKATFSLLGFGVIQAWTSLMMLEMRVASSLSFGYSQLGFDIGSVPVFLLLLFLAHKFTPLFKKRSPTVLSVVVMLVGNAIIAVAVIFPVLPSVVSIIGLLIVGCGSALLIICWWEIYGMLNPMVTAFFYAGSWILSEVILFVLAGYNSTYLLAASFFLPLISAIMLNYGRKWTEAEDLAPKILFKPTLFPWKPMLLVGLYSFAYGFATWTVFFTDNLYLRLGTLIPAAFVCASIVFAYRKFNFTTIYRFFLPVAIIGLLALLFVSNIGIDITTLFIRASYVAVEIYVFILLCNLSRRFHVSAAWLCSLFNITHIVTLGLGALAFLSLPSLAILGICIICIVLVTFIIISEPTLMSDWRILISNKDDSLIDSANQEIAIDMLSKQYDLSPREKEVFALLAKGNQPRMISKELYIALGTVKAHIQRIYKKVGVHSKEELLNLLKG